MPKASKKPSVSHQKAASSAASILEQLGGSEAVTVHVFRRIEGGKLAFLRAYTEDEASNVHDRVLTDFGPGFYVVQVKEGTRIAGSRQMTCGDVTQLTPPTPEAKPAKSDDEVGGGMLVKLLIAQQQQTTQILTTMIQSQAQRPTESLGLKDVLGLLAPMLKDRSGIGEALEAIKVAQELSPAESSGGGDASSLIGAIGQIAAAIPQAIRELKGVQPATRKAVENTAANGTRTSSDVAGGVGNGTPVGNDRARSEAETATQTESPPAAGSPTPPPPVERVALPFPGADVIASRLLGLLAMVPGDEPLHANALGGSLDQVCAVAIEEIELAGGDVADVLDWYPPDAGGIGDALCKFDSRLTRAAAPLKTADHRIREIVKWEPEDAEDRDQT